MKQNFHLCFERRITMYKPVIGDVVKDNGYPVVVVDLKNYEKCWQLFI